MLSASKLVQSALECLGWPYVSPGSNDQNGIDCSGLLVKCFRDQGASIYHGSNTIYRKYCDPKGPITSSTKLLPAYVVFKWKPEDTPKYPDGLGDFCHIGIVTGVNPIEITHASSVAGCVTIDTNLKNWKYWGALKDVDYNNMISYPNDDSHIPSEPELIGQPDDYGLGGTYASVYSENGKPVKLRQQPSTSCKLYDELPVGTIVEVIGQKSEWSQVNYGNRHGWWMMSQYLKDDTDGSNDEFDDSDDGTVTLIIDKLTEAEANELMKEFPQAVKSYG